MTHKNPDIIIIGGGVIGTSIAYHLACQGARPLIVEGKDLASGSSGACDGLIFLQSKKPGIHLELALKSQALFKNLSTALPFDIEFKQTGGMVIIENDAEYQAMQAYAKEQQTLGLEVTILDRDQARKKEPGLSKKICGAAWSPLDGQVNPMALAIGFARGAQEKGAQILSHTRVVDLMVKANRVTGIQTDKGPIQSDFVVNACGARAGAIGAMAGLNFPITPRRGQIVVTQAVKPMISHCMISAKYIAAKFNPELAKQAGEGLSMEQTENGNLLLGSTREFTGFDTQNTVEGLSSILEKTTGILPGLKGLQIIRSFAGLRPYTPDGLPLIGPVKGLDGFFMAAGHEGDGIALSPITGDLVSKMILKKNLDLDLSPFSPNRFLDTKES